MITPGDYWMTADNLVGVHHMDLDVRELLQGVSHPLHPIPRLTHHELGPRAHLPQQPLQPRAGRRALPLEHAPLPLIDRIGHQTRATDIQTGPRPSAAPFRW